MTVAEKIAALARRLFEARSMSDRLQAELDALVIDSEGVGLGEEIQPPPRKKPTNKGLQVGRARPGERRRQILELHDRGLHFKVIAAELGISYANARVGLGKALAARGRR